MEKRNYDEIKLHIKNKIKEKVLDEKVCSQVELGKAANVNKSTVFAWIYETACPDSARIPLIAEALHISVAELVGTDDNQEELNKAIALYDAYKKHPDVQIAINHLLEIK